MSARTATSLLGRATGPTSPPTSTPGAWFKKDDRRSDVTAGDRADPYLPGRPHRQAACRYRDDRRAGSGRRRGPSKCRSVRHLVRGRPHVGVGGGWPRLRARQRMGGSSGGPRADSAFDSSRPWTGSYRAGQQKTMAQGFEYGHGPPKTLTDDCPADGIQKVRGSNPLGSTTKSRVLPAPAYDRLWWREVRLRA